MVRHSSLSEEIIKKTSNKKAKRVMRYEIIFFIADNRKPIYLKAKNIFTKDNLTPTQVK